jgi:hypothetical protein
MSESFANRLQKIRADCIWDPFNNCSTNQTPTSISTGTHR